MIFCAYCSGSLYAYAAYGPMCPTGMSSIYVYIYVCMCMFINVYVYYISMSNVCVCDRERERVCLIESVCMWLSEAEF